jgi:hypothetical protein
MEKNTYFEHMRNTAIAYNEAQAIREKEEFPYPFTAGQNKALVLYDRSLRNGADAFEADDLPWDYELADFVETLRNAGIKAIVVTDQSTGLMDGIYGLTNLGCRMNGLKTVTRADDHRFGSKEPERKTASNSSSATPRRNRRGIAA